MSVNRSAGVALSLAALMLMVAGCAALAPGSGGQAVAAVCLPPGVSQLPPVGEIEDARPVRTPQGPGLFLSYATMHVVVVRGHVLAVDLEPARPVGLVWVREVLPGFQWRQELVGATAL